MRRWGAGLSLLVAGLAGVALILFYVERIFAPLPLYAGDEGTYLARSLHRLALVQRPDAFPQLLPLNNTVHLRLIQVVHSFSASGLEWMRLIGLASYLGGLLLLHRLFAGALPGREGRWFLLLALCFPYYRFVVTAMPEGLYVLVLCGIIAWTAWSAPRWPLLFAAVAGVAAAALTLVKSQGVVVMPALACLILLQGLAGRDRPTAVVLRLAALAAAYLLCGAAISLVAGIGTVSPLRFFRGEGYDVLLGARVQRPEGPFLAMLGLAGMGAALLVLAAPPLLAGLGAILGPRWAARRQTAPLDGREAAFLLLLLVAAGTVAMVAIFAWQISFIPSETRRLWGRYFEFLVPMAWLVGAPFLTAQDGGAGRCQFVTAAAVLLGLAGLGAVLAQRVVVFPWDATALSAFYWPDATRWPFVPDAPYLKLAVAATLAVIAAVLAGVRPHRAWGAYFAALALISTHYDRAWHRDVAVGRAMLAAELPVAAALATAPPGQVVILAHDPNAAYNAFLALDGRADMAPWAPVAPLSDQHLARYRQVVVISTEDLPAQEWREVFAGRVVSVFERR